MKSGASSWMVVADSFMVNRKIMSFNTCFRAALINSSEDHIIDKSIRENSDLQKCRVSKNLENL